MNNRNHEKTMQYLKLFSRVTKVLGRICASVVMAFAITGATHAQSTTVTFYHNDALGSPVAATNADGDVLWRKTYDPYGSELNDGGLPALNNSIGYTGHLRDNDLDLVYAGARYYDPEIGRFVSIDPAGFQEGMVQSFNKYAYANNNPYAFIDPNGEEALEFNYVWFGVTVGEDDASLQPFWKGRIGLVGLGAMFYTEYYFANPDHVRGVGVYEGDNKRAEIQNAEGRLGGSVAIGIWSANLTVLEGYERFTHVTDSDGKVSPHQDSKAAEWGFDLKGRFTLGRKSQVELGKNKPFIGLNLDSDLYYEIGTLVPWTDLTNDGKQHKWPPE